MCERSGIDHRHRSSTDAGAQRVDAGRVAELPGDILPGREVRDPFEIADPVGCAGRGRGLCLGGLLSTGPAPIAELPTVGLLSIGRPRPLADDARPALEVLVAVDERVIDDEAAAACDPALERLAPGAAQAPV